MGIGVTFGEVWADLELPYGSVVASGAAGGFRGLDI